MQHSAVGHWSWQRLLGLLYSWPLGVLEKEEYNFLLKNWTPVLSKMGLGACADVFASVPRVLHEIK